MTIIRPIVLNDFNDLLQMAIDSGQGFTSLPNDSKFLKRRIVESVEAFEANITEAGPQNYLFVMQDTATGEVVGCSGIQACVGQTSPLYHHRVERCLRRSDTLNIRQELQTLTLCTDLKGSTEICSLYLKDSHRINRNGAALSRFRFLFMAAHRQRFSTQIIAEMRGYSDEQGLSPFWTWFEQNFQNISFARSNHNIGIGDMRFASELMPKHPLYTCLMSQSAQQAINQVHADTVPALTLLEKEGFKSGDYIGVNDAGPAVLCALDKIETVLKSHTKQVRIATVNNEQSQYLVCNHKLTDFRAVLAAVDLTEDNVLIGNELAQVLNVTEGEWLSLVES